MRTKEIIYGMLIENTGTHFLDSGGAYGRAWERNQGKTIKGTVLKLSIQGMVKYGFQLTVVELCTILGIYMIRLIIDYLHDQSDKYFGYHFLLFLAFNASRLIAILVRNYYDLHVYNHFRFIQTAIQAWIFEDISKLRLWTKIGAEEKSDDVLTKNKKKKLKDCEA